MSQQQSIATQNDDPGAMPQGEAQPDGQTEPVAQTHPQHVASEQAPTPRGKAFVVALLTLAIIGLLVSWYALSDRWAPSASRGMISAFIAQIAPRVPGQVTEVFVQDNDMVEAGQPLFQLDKRPFELAVGQAEVGLAQAMQSNQASVAALAASQARVSQARANLENARSTQNRNESLFARGVATRAQLQKAEADTRVAAAQLEAAEADLESATVQLGGNGENNYQVKAAQLQLEQAQLNLLYSTVRAPTSGVVTNIKMAIGHYAPAGSPAMTFMDARGAWISVDLRENQLGNVEAGDSVDILFDVAPGQIYTGKVHSIAWGIDPGRTSAGGLMQNQPENKWFEPARRIPVHIEMEGGLDSWPRVARAGGKVSVVIYTEGRNGIIASLASLGLRINSWLSYLY